MSTKEMPAEKVLAMLRTAHNMPGATLADFIAAGIVKPNEIGMRRVRRQQENERKNPGAWPRGTAS